MKPSNLLILPLLGVLSLSTGCSWMDAYPDYQHTTAGDEHKSGPGSYGGTNTADTSQGGPTSDLPGSGTSDAAGSGVTNNSTTNFTGNSSETTGPGLSGTTTYSGSSVAGSSAGQTNNNGTTGTVSPGTR